MAWGPWALRNSTAATKLGLIWRRTITDLLRGRVKASAPRSWGGYFRNDADHRDFTAIGTAAGMQQMSGFLWMAHADSCLVQEV